MKKPSFTILDLVILVIAMGGGARLAMSDATRTGRPFDNLLIRAVFLGGFVFCPLVFFEQYVFRHREGSPKFGEWLWIGLSVWMAINAAGIPSGVVLFTFFVVGMPLNATIFIAALGYLTTLIVRSERDPHPWTDYFGLWVSVSFPIAFWIMMLTPIDPNGWP